MFDMQTIKEFRKEIEKSADWKDSSLKYMIDDYFENQNEIDKVGTYPDLRTDILKLFKIKHMRGAENLLDHIRDSIEYTDETKEFLFYIKEKVRFIEKKYYKKMSNDLEKRKFKISKRPSIIAKMEPTPGISYFCCGIIEEISMQPEVFSFQLSMKYFDIYEKGDKIVSKRTYHIPGSLQMPVYFKLSSSPTELHNLKTFEKQYGKDFRKIIENEIEELEVFHRKNYDTGYVTIDANDSVEDVVKKAKALPKNTEPMFQFSKGWHDFDKLDEELGWIVNYKKSEWFKNSP